MAHRSARLVLLLTVVFSVLALAPAVSAQSCTLTAAPATATAPATVAISGGGWMPHQPVALTVTGQGARSPVPHDPGTFTESYAGLPAGQYTATAAGTDAAGAACQVSASFSVTAPAAGTPAPQPTAAAGGGSGAMPNAAVEPAGPSAVAVTRPLGVLLVALALVLASRATRTRSR